MHLYKIFFPAHLRSPVGTGYSYIFSNSGAFVSTLMYCLYLHNKEKTFKEYASGESRVLGINYLMALLTGFLWYGQFFFYGLGHIRMGNYKFSSWAIHMILLLLLSSFTGLLMKEWKNWSAKTRRNYARKNKSPWFISFPIHGPTAGQNRESKTV